MEESNKEKNDNSREICIKNKTYELINVIFNPYGKNINERYIYPLSEERLVNEKNDEIICKISYDCQTQIREYKVFSGNYSFLPNGVLKNSDTNKIIGVYKVPVKIRNTTPNIIGVRVSSNGIGNDNEFNISDYGAETWDRNPGEVIVQIKEKGNIHKFLVNSPGDYFYSNGRFYDESSSFFNNKNLKFSNEKGNISLKNGSAKKILIGVSTNGEGSDAFWPLENNKMDNWARNHGKFFVGIKDFDSLSYQYEVVCPGKYTYKGKGEFIDEETGKALEKADNE